MCCPSTSNYPQQPPTKAPPPSTNVTCMHPCSTFSRSRTFCRGCRVQFRSRGGLSLHQRRCQPFQFIVKAIIASPSALLPSKSSNKSNDASKQEKEIVVSNTNFIIILILFIDQCQFLLTRYITVLVTIYHRHLSSAEVSQHHYMIALNK